jgi:hypothetical protein
MNEALLASPNQPGYLHTTVTHSSFLSASSQVCSIGINFLSYGRVLTPITVMALHGAGETQRKILKTRP